MSSGLSLVPLADIDGDGIEDLGLASAGARIGSAVAGGADLDADGMPDLATNLASVSTSGAEQPPGLLFVSGNSL